MILAQENGVPVDLIFVVVVLVISALVSLIRWLNRTFGGQAKKEESVEAPRRAESAPGDEAPATDSSEALRNFLEEMTGRRPAAPAEGTRRPVERRPQRPPRERHRLEPEPVDLEEAPERPRAADRPAARPRPSQRRAPKQASRPRPAPRPQPKRSTQELAVLEEAEASRQMPRQDMGRSYGASRTTPREDWISTLPGSDLQRAVLLMEILGPPRAKKPHGSR